MNFFENFSVRQCSRPFALCMAYDREKEGFSCRYAVIFGLRAETETERGWLPLLTLSDVSCDEEFIRAFAQRCTECGLSPIHLTDAVLDALP